MDTAKAPDEIDRHRRRFFGAAAAAIAATQFATIGSAAAQSDAVNLPATPTIRPGTGTSSLPPKQIDAGVLNVSYAEVGPTDGRPVLLLHGWPYDIHSYAKSRRYFS